MCLFDFVFEREVQEGNEKILKSGIKVGEDNKPPTKISKPGNEFDKTNQTDSTRIEDGRSSKRES